MSVKSVEQNPHFPTHFNTITAQFLDRLFAHQLIFPTNFVGKKNALISPSVPHHGTAPKYMTLKNIFIRLALVWVLLAQMFYVCLAANTTVSLSKLEANYAFVPSPAHKNSLDNEFERVAIFESQRALAKFGGMLLIDVALIAMFWNFGMKRKSAVAPTSVLANGIAGQLSAS